MRRVYAVLRMNYPSRLGFIDGGNDRSGSREKGDSFQGTVTLTSSEKSVSYPEAS